MVNKDEYKNNTGTPTELPFGQILPVIIIIILFL